MAKVLVVDDAFEDLQVLVLAGAGGRNLPVAAVDPPAGTWAQVLTAGNLSGDNNAYFSSSVMAPRGIIWNSDPLGVDIAASILLTGAELQISGLADPFFNHGVRIGGPGGVAFNDGAMAYKPAIVGSCAGNVALMNLLANLASLGLITDNTTP